MRLFRRGPGDDRGHKTVSFSGQLRVPARMSVSEIKDFLRTAVNCEPGHHHPEDDAFDVTLYRDRIEVFMP